MSWSATPVIVTLQANAVSLNRLTAERDGASRRAESLAMSLAALKDDYERLKQACAGMCLSFFMYVSMQHAHAKHM